MINDEKIEKIILDYKVQIKRSKKINALGFFTAFFIGAVIIWDLMRKDYVSSIAVSISETCLIISQIFLYKSIKIMTESYNRLIEQLRKKTEEGIVKK